MINIREFLGLSYYTSELDTFLHAFDQANPKLSVSQRKEIEKYSRIYSLRDNVIKAISEKILWKNF